MSLYDSVTPTETYKYVEQRNIDGLWRQEKCEAGTWIFFSFLLLFSIFSILEDTHCLLGDYTDKRFHSSNKEWTTWLVSIVKTKTIHNVQNETLQTKWKCSSNSKENAKLVFFQHSLMWCEVEDRLCFHLVWDISPICLFFFPICLYVFFPTSQHSHNNEYLVS